MKALTQTFWLSSQNSVVLILKNFIQIVNLQTLAVTAGAVASTATCIHFGIQADFPLTLVATAIVFPIVFSINSAYKRRETALREYASLKSHGKAVYFVTRDCLESPDKNTLEHARSEIIKLLEACRQLFTGSQNQLRQNEEHVYRQFSRLSRFVRNDLRANGLASGECSRTNQYLSKMFISFENMKHVYQYRTPRTLRLFSYIFVSLLPVIYGPYFAHKATEYTPGLGYVMPVLFAVVLVSLSNIQEHLENPFDQIGEDDICINTEQFFQRMYEPDPDQDQQETCSGAGLNSTF